MATIDQRNRLVQACKSLGLGCPLKPPNCSWSNLGAWAVSSEVIVRPCLLGHYLVGQGHVRELRKRAFSCQHSAEGHTVEVRQHRS